MGYYKFTKKELLKELEQVDDDDCIMINMGGHAQPDYPITHIEDSPSIGFWELRCDPEISFWDALHEDTKKRKKK